MGPDIVARPRRQDVQGLRAIAVLMVVAYHATLPVPGGYTGVDVFFVISGFVITRMIRRELVRSDRINFSNFYRRRARRLLPALALVTTLTLLASAIIEAPFGAQQTTAALGRATSLFLANFEAWRQPSGYFGLGTTTDPLVHMWSLGVEEQFYLLFPISLLVAWLLGRGMRRGSDSIAAPAVAGVSVFSLLLCVLLTRHSAVAAFYLIPTRAWEFGAGALLAFAEPALLSGRSRSRSVIAGAGGLMLIAAAAFALNASTPFPGVAALIPVAGAALIVAAGSLDPAPLAPVGVTRALALPPLVFIGGVSYSWYLWHWPAIVLSRELFPDASAVPIIAGCASFVPAWLTTRYVEDPIRTQAVLGRVPTLVLAAVCIAVPLVASEFVLTEANHGWGDSRLARDHRLQASNTIAASTGCLQSGIATTAKLRSCVWNTTASRSDGTILLVGDSHAGSLSNGLLIAARHLGYNVQIGAGSGCSFTPASRYDTDALRNCAQFYEMVLHRATHGSKPRLVVMADADWSEAGILGKEGFPHPLAAWAADVGRSLAALHRASVPVLVVDDVPWITLSPTPCRFGAVIAVDCKVLRSFADKLEGPARQAVTAQARRYGDRTLSLENLFCTRTTCNAIQKGRLMYYDDQHLNAAGSKYVAGALETALRETVGAHAATSEP